jgi:lipopolysaccharide transport system ATP-binding protein
MEDVSKNQGRTVLFVSHNMGVVAQLCHRAIVLNKGQIDFNGDVPSAIDHYMDQQQKHSRYIAERKDKEIYFEYVELQDSEGNPCNHFVVNRKLFLKFKIVVQSTLKTQARLSCTIQNKHGDFLSTFVEDLDAHFESDQMSREFVIQYPAGLLAPNAYAFRLAIFMGRGRVFDLLEMICPFTMVDEGGEMAVYEGAHYGYFPSHQQFIAL